jgi:hypothetical protein
MVLYTLAPPHGSRSLLGIVVGLLAGGYIAVTVYEYVRSGTIPPIG